ncbi:MAG TPA: HlyD family efflux transporter periplasmic adaptor subunit [Blastocatellia bacterium]|nr:HlyD family efflux transporter periplasmic adaptor subunit [Blastocatellia bacterium]
MPKPLRILLVLLILGGVGYFIWSKYFRVQADPHRIEVAGRIEGDDATLASKVAGRIREIKVREGDAVKAGDVIAVLDDDQIRAREQQAQSAVEQAQARVQRTQQQIAVFNEQLKGSEVSEQQARTDAEGRVSQAEAQVAAAEAALAQAEAAYKFAKWDEEKFVELRESGDVPERQMQQARTNAAAQAEIVRAAKKQVEAARGGLRTAQAMLKNPVIRSAQTATLRQQIAQANTDIEAAQADVARARSQLEEAQATRRDLQIVAPFDGTVQTRAVEPGEVVAPGTPIITLIDLHHLYLRGFVPEGQIGNVKIGQQARVWLDATEPGTKQRIEIEAEVARIDPQASFTPENTYFRDDRIKQVFGVKLILKGGFKQAKPGMPADGEILVN